MAVNGLVQLSANRRLVAESVGTSKLIREKVSEIRRLRQEGWKLKALAAKFGVAVSTVSLAARGDTWSTPTAQTLLRATVEHAEAIRQLVAIGLGYQPIADRLGLTGQSVHDFMKRHGLQGTNPSEVNKNAEACAHGHPFKVLSNGHRRCPESYRVYQKVWQRQRRQKSRQEVAP